MQKRTFTSESVKTTKLNIFSWDDNAKMNLLILLLLVIIIVFVALLFGILYACYIIGSKLAIEQGDLLTQIALHQGEIVRLAGLIAGLQLNFNDLILAFTPPLDNVTAFGIKTGDYYVFLGGLLSVAVSISTIWGDNPVTTIPVNTLFGGLGSIAALFLHITITGFGNSQSKLALALKTLNEINELQTKLQHEQLLLELAKQKLELMNTFLGFFWL